MPQISKLIRSRDDWKAKAVERYNELREYRKTKKRYEEKIAKQKKQIHELEQIIEDNKKSIMPTTGKIIDIRQTQETRSLCIMIAFQSIVSYRSIPKIISLFNIERSLGLNWVPHFTSIINWSLRLGLGLLKQVIAIPTPWLAIIDHSIDIGTKKVLVVLRVNLTALSMRGSAIHLNDCECVGLKIRDVVNGENVAKDLQDIFNKAGIPAAIIKDDDATLGKGVRLWSSAQVKEIPVIKDISHSMAIALKNEFEDNSFYKKFIDIATKGANLLRQTDMAFLIPPKLRSKGRFISISKLGKWADKILPVFSVKGRSKKDSLLDKLRTAFPGFIKLKSFIKRFASTTQIVAQVMEILKNKGLDKTTYDCCYELSQALPKNSKVKKDLQKWLTQHFDIQKKLTKLPLLVSSDIIESLFGNFKHIIERNPQADMNRTTLLIPALCGHLDKEIITQAINQTCHNDLKVWDKENIPYTLRKKRQLFFDLIKSQKAVNA